MSEEGICVVIPSYNRAAHLPRAIESILQQDGLAELTVVDDGSTDNTPDVVKPYLSRIRYIRTENRERGAARNRGAAEASSAFVTFCDSDDRMLPGHLMSALDTFRANPTAGAVYSDAVLEAASGTVVGHVRGARAAGYRGRPPVTSLIANFDNCALLQGGTVYRLSAFRAVGGFREDRDLAGSEDFELNTRMLANYAFVPTHRATFAYCTHAGNTFANPRLSARCMVAAVDRVSSNATLMPYADLFPRMRACAHIAIASSFVASGERREAAQHLSEAVRNWGPIVLEPRFWRLSLRLAAGKSAVVILRKMRSTVRRPAR